jgi:hypothetical protein
MPFRHPSWPEKDNSKWVAFMIRGRKVCIPP